MKAKDFFMATLVGTTIAGLLSLVFDVINTDIVVYLYFVSTIVCLICYHFILKYQKN